MVSFFIQIYTLRESCLPESLVESHCLSEITKFESCNLFRFCDN